MNTVNIFTSADPGAAPVLSGTAGALVTVLDEVLILGRGFSFNGNTLGFTDNSAALRQRGAGVALFPQPAAGDILYLGGLKKFAQAILNLTTLGTGGTFVFEYWDGAAWSALISPTDGTSGLTASGTISWDRNAQTGWAQTAVNSVTLFWVRIRCTATPSVGAQANLASIYGWGSPFQGTNGRTYRSELTDGVQHYFNLNDNAPGAGTGKEARFYGAEVMSAFDTVTSGRFPSAAQFANGQFIRKSVTADGTARAWQVFADEKTVYLMVLTGDVASTYFSAGFGEYFSLVPGDLYRSFVSCRRGENDGSSFSNSLSIRLQTGNSSSTLQQGTYVPRPFSGVGSSLLIALLAGAPAPYIAGVLVGNVPTFNGPDGGIIIGPVYFNESSHIRGRFRGLVDQFHAQAAWTDGDVFQGTGFLSAKAFKVLRQVQGHDQNGNVSNGVMVFETSDTWETN